MGSSTSPLRYLIAILTSMTLPVSAQYFFPGGQDFVHYVPNVPGTPAGRIYIGDFTDVSRCHYRLDLPPGKPVKAVRIQWFAGSPLAFVSRPGEVSAYSVSSFELVDSDGKHCSQPTPGGSKTVNAAGAEFPTTIRVSNDADSFDLTCNGAYAVVVGANSATPVSLIDVATRQEVDTFVAESNVTGVTTFDDGESVVVVQNIPPRNVTNRLRRLKIVNGKLIDTGESLAASPSGDFPDYRFKKVFAVPGSKVGVAIAEFGLPQIVSFAIPGMKVLDTVTSGGGHSGAVSCRGDTFYVRAGSQIRGYKLDPITGLLSDAPVLTISGVGEIDASGSNFGNALAVSQDGTRLIVTEGTAFPSSPPTPRTTYFNTSTGERLGFFEEPDGGSPTLVATLPCCAGTRLSLDIQRTASGQIQILASGDAGQNYELQLSEDLMVWDKVLDFEMPAFPFTYTAPDSSSDSSRFYRLTAMP